MEQAVKDQREYEVAYADCAQWLESSADDLSKCHNTAGDWKELEGRIDAVRVSVIYFTAHMINATLWHTVKLG